MQTPLSLEPSPTLWTFASLHKKRSPGRNSLSIWAHIAKMVEQALLEPPLAGPPDDVFAEAVQRLSGSRLDELRDKKMGLVDEASFSRDRIAPLRRQYGLDDLDYHRYHPPARVLILHAAEYRFVPYAEGTLAAVVWEHSTPRWDVRTAIHTVTRWSSMRDPMLARLAAAALSPDDEPRPWRPLTQYYDAILENHRRDDAQRKRDARSLSKRTIGAIIRAARQGTGHGGVVRELMYAAEELSVLPPRPRFERDERARRASELTRLLLDLELGRDLGERAEPLLDLVLEDFRRAAR
jgi:hypothetical protein